jgi:hypothetical protein
MSRHIIPKQTRRIHFIADPASWRSQNGASLFLQLPPRNYTEAAPGYHASLISGCPPWANRVEFNISAGCPVREQSRKWRSSILVRRKRVFVAVPAANLLTSSAAKVHSAVSSLKSP